MDTCTGCQKAAKKEDVYCRNCGMELPDVETFECDCGAEIEGNDNFCNQCGVEFDGVVDSDAQPQGSQQQNFQAFMYLQEIPNVYKS